MEQGDGDSTVILEYRRGEAERLERRLTRSVPMVKSMIHRDPGMADQWNDLFHLLIGLHAGLIAHLAQVGPEEEE